MEPIIRAVCQALKDDYLEQRVPCYVFRDWDGYPFHGFMNSYDDHHGIPDRAEVVWIRLRQYKMTERVEIIFPVDYSVMINRICHFEIPYRRDDLNNEIYTYGTKTGINPPSWLLKMNGCSLYFKQSSKGLLFTTNNLPNPTRIVFDKIMVIYPE